MLPRTPWANSLYVSTLVVSGVFLVGAVGATILTHVSHEGWVATAVLAYLLWIVTIPLLVISGMWSLILVILRRRRRDASR